MPSSHLILCLPLLLLPSIFPSFRVFSNDSALHIKWPKDWSFSFNISPSNEHPGLISFRVDWLDLLAVRRTLRSLLQHHSSKASILCRSAFFIVQLSHPEPLGCYFTTHVFVTLCKPLEIQRRIWESLFLWSIQSASNLGIWCPCLYVRGEAEAQCGGSRSSTTQDTSEMRQAWPQSPELLTPFIVFFPLHLLLFLVNLKNIHHLKVESYVLFGRDF